MSISTNIFVTQSGQYTDISNVFQAGNGPLTKIYKGGVDIGQYFSAYTTGTKADLTKIYLAGEDLAAKFAKKSTITIITPAGTTGTLDTNLTNEYHVCRFTSSTSTLTVSNIGTAIDFYYLVVGGGGGGGYRVSGGGGAGAVIQGKTTIQPTSSNVNITITIGSGGAKYNNGGNSSIVFSGGFSKQIIAYGGGAGGSIGARGNGGLYVGSSGGVGQAFNSLPSNSSSIEVSRVIDSDYNNYGVNNGGSNTGIGGGGGGGAGGIGGNGDGGGGGAGGIGVKTSNSLLGIANFSLNNKIYGDLYWGGGGGGGGVWSSAVGGGGSGLGGGGGMNTGVGSAGNNTSSINAAIDFAGGVNTGGGGGGAPGYQGPGPEYAGPGGSGIVILSCRKIDITVLALSTTSELLPIPSGLTNHYNFTSVASYPGGGTAVQNLVTGVKDMTIVNGSTYNTPSKTIYLNASAGNQHLLCDITFQSISIWYKQLPQPEPAGSRYLFDGRPSVSQSWVYRGGSTDDVGQMWTSCYFDGGSNITPVGIVGRYTDDTWHNVTYTSTTSGARSTQFRFGANSDGAESMTIEIAVILVYNRLISPAENTQNYNIYKNILTNAGLPV